MSETWMLALAGAAGGGLGAVFFGGLWWTVRKAAASKRAPLWFVLSLALRTGIVLAGFYAVAGGRWERLLLCLSGFVASRFVVIRLTRDAGKAACLTPEA